MTKSKVLRRGFASKFSVFANLGQVIPSGVPTLVTMGTGVNYDLLGEFNVATYLFTPHKAGYYYFHASVGIQALGIGDAVEIWIRLNAGNIAYMQYTTPIIQNGLVQIDAVAYVLPTDTVSVYVGHNFGANRNLLNGFVFSRFDGFRI